MSNLKELFEQHTMETYKRLKVSNDKIETKGDKVTAVKMTASDTEVQLSPNVYYEFPEMETLTITLKNVEAGNTELPVYAFKFISGETPTELSFPRNLEVIGNVVSNKTYQVSIMDGLVIVYGY